MVVVEPPTVSHSPTASPHPATDRQQSNSTTNSVNSGDFLHHGAGVGKTDDERAKGNRKRGTGDDDEEDDSVSSWPGGFLRVCAVASTCGTYELDFRFGGTPGGQQHAGAVGIAAEVSGTTTTAAVAAAAAPTRTTNTAAAEGGRADATATVATSSAPVPNGHHRQRQRQRRLQRRHERPIGIPPLPRIADNICRLRVGVNFMYFAGSRSSGAPTTTGTASDADHHVVVLGLPSQELAVRPLSQVEREHRHGPGGGGGGGDGNGDGDGDGDGAADANAALDDVAALCSVVCTELVHDARGASKRPKQYVCVCVSPVV